MKKYKFLCKNPMSTPGSNLAFQFLSVPASSVLDYTRGRYSCTSIRLLRSIRNSYEHKICFFISKSNCLHNFVEVGLTIRELIDTIN